MSWLNVSLNESISNFKGQLSSLASNVLADDLEDPDAEKVKIDDLQTVIQKQENEIKRLQNENSEILKRIADLDSNHDDENDEPANWSWDCNNDSAESSTTHLDWKLKIQELENEKAELLVSLEQLDQDCQQTTERLITMKDELQSENQYIKLQLEDLKKENALLYKGRDVDNERIKQLEESNRDFKGNSVPLTEYQKLETALKQFEKQLENVENLHGSAKSEAGDSAAEAFHRKYIDILGDAIKMCVEFELPPFESGESNEKSGDPLEYYAETVQNVVKILMDYKWKCETLEKQMQEMSEEKTKLLGSKNVEIERLLANSEQLSADIIQKAKTIKEYEEECKEMSRNNELLVSRLGEYEEMTSKLQTIPETNENLEGQLEKCHVRIEELEGLLKRRKIESSVLEGLKSQLSASEKELEESVGNSEGLSGQCAALMTDNECLKSELKALKDHLAVCCHQNEDLVDQIRHENDNAAVQSINIETLNEEIETLTTSIEKLSFENEKLGTLNAEIHKKLEVAEKEVAILKQELTSEIDTSRQKDQQINEITKVINELEENATKLSEEVKKLSLENEDLLGAKSRYLSAFVEIKRDVDHLITSYQLMKSCSVDNSNLQEIIKEKNELLDKLATMDEIVNEKKCIQAKMELLQLTLNTLQLEKSEAVENSVTYCEKLKEMEEQINQLTISRNEVIQLVQVKHQESVNYHEEIKRLQSLLNVETEKCKIFESQLQDLNGSMSPEDLAEKDKEIERLQDLNSFLKEKCNVLTENLLKEQQNNSQILNSKATVSEKELALQKQLDSLKEHLLKMEESYTQEIQTAEALNEELKEKLHALVEKEKFSSNKYTSANIRANQQLETLQTNLNLVANQRDEFKRKVSDMEDQLAKQNAALVNLQAVLAQYQREKERVINEEKERVRRQIIEEKKAQEALAQQNAELAVQLEESKQGLKAAVRLSDQVEHWKKQCFIYKDEVSKLQRLLQKAEETLNQSDGRVDKMLVKNLVIGLVGCERSQPRERSQILRVISTVLDFNQQDLEKIDLNNKGQSNWFSQLLSPSSTGAASNLSQETLTQAFVKFLEAESAPRNLPNLLEATEGSSAKSSEPSNESRDAAESNKNMRRPSLSLNEVVLPTFADFGASRNSSSILKDVLKDNSNS